MSKTILLTGATDGIGRETAKMLAEQGHHLLLHGRNPKKLDTVIAELGGEPYLADLSRMADVKNMAAEIGKAHQSLDVIINNAGILKTPITQTEEGLEVRFAVNSIAPYLLTQMLLPLMNEYGRVINLSSAAQSPISLDALSGKQTNMADMAAYSQSKLAITMWSRMMGESKEDNMPSFIAVNPGSLLGSKMVKEGFGIAGSDIRIGADILERAALSEEFSDASGKYYDNDAKRFTAPHKDALNDEKCQQVITTMENILSQIMS